MATLEGQSIALSYEQLLHVDRDGGGNTTNYVAVKDGDNGTTFDIELATANLKIPSGNLVIGTAGKGIDFSNQASPASGMTAELLDRYETGTWTGQLSDGSTNMTMSATTGYYTRVGNLVTVSGYFTTSSLNGLSSEAIRISGLPFTVANNAAAYTGCGAALGGGYAITAGHYISYYAEINADYLYLNVWDAEAGMTGMLASEWSSNGQIIIGFSYRAA